jgi:hypothetical protein
MIDFGTESKENAHYKELARQREEEAKNSKSVFCSPSLFAPTGSYHGTMTPSIFGGYNIKLDPDLNGD